MAQLTYGRDHQVAVLGHPANSEFSHVESKIVDAANGDIVLGMGVVKVPGNDKTVKLPDATDNDLYGIAQRTQALESGLPNQDYTPKYEDKDVANIKRRGGIWVWCETAFNPDTDTLYLRHTTNGSNVRGNFRNDADTANAVAVTGAYSVKNTLTAAGLLEIEILKPA